MTRIPAKYVLLAAIALGVAVTDQVTKYLAVSRLTHAYEMPPCGGDAPGLGARVGRFYTCVRHPEPIGRDVVVIPGFWNHRYVENPGAAWGLLARLPESVRIPFILVFFRRLEPDQRMLQMALSFVLGGAIGNFLDRLHLSYVIDFIDWHIKDAHWPTFNVADSCICVGVGLLLLESRLARKPATAAAEVARTGTEP
jgi:signal peptidase II